MDELKTCPFCGSEEITSLHQVAQCDACYATADHETWNRRYSNCPETPDSSK